MWLERLSGHTTPSASPPSSRPYSPAPRKSSHLAPPARPTFSQRSSSLNPASTLNDSPLSLLRKTNNGVGAKAKAGDAPDPVDTLEKLIGTVDAKRKTKQNRQGLSNDGGSDAADAIDSVDFGGLGLYELATAEDIPSDDVHVYRSQTVEECMYVSSVTPKFQIY